MSTLYVDRRQVDLDVEADTIVMRIDGARQGTAPLGTIVRIVIKGGGKLSTRLLSKLAERGIALFVLGSRNREPTAAMLASPSGDGALRVSQYRLSQDEQGREALSAAIVTAKSKGQRRVLSLPLQSSNDRSDQQVRRADEALENAINLLEQPSRYPSSRATLRGIEGSAARQYFAGLQAYFPPSLGFEGRNKRPPRDPVNVGLSLGYTLLHAEAVQAVTAAGLDPMLGIYHDLQPGRPSLASDLIEPARFLIDETVIELFRDDRLRAEHFTTSQSGCRLGKAGRQAAYRAFESDGVLRRRWLRRLTNGLVRWIREYDNNSGNAVPQLLISPASSGSEE